jgi:hypothetical protein
MKLGGGGPQITSGEHGGEAVGALEVISKGEKEGIAFLNLDLELLNKKCSTWKSDKVMVMDQVYLSASLCFLAASTSSTD